MHSDSGVAARTWTWLTSSCRCCSCVLDAMAPCRDRTPLMSLLTTLARTSKIKCWAKLGPPDTFSSSAMCT